MIMVLSRRLTIYLTVLTVAAATLASRADAEGKVNSCCTEVSRKKITSPILGYRIQRWNPPCVKAVIFETEDGPKCSHWKEDWVFQKVKELETVRKSQTTPASRKSLGIPGRT